ncbi:uncharacterized protein PGTG_01641 [Puccinia graminis f. sp. tritici CRL 75-36-700-3]|uniref:Uncharacterized protein n=1 Tax=Puccinia graminis f. sp. tritici (strain CRL 75-36-700-3 / race SCCL) TaxID=418459 RepID=E3JSM3_PUCGT|nr:uncharacterized protein PGTG_01641 [Puccinia graminis f. sp. tritici CRL 75-36-700-3]EFP75048.2 hypothetical protein PGTG_01641 [Puccinia graminis f. sp. tritici CRL 75-36-700-3]
MKCTGDSTLLGKTLRYCIPKNTGKHHCLALQGFGSFKKTPTYTTGACRRQPARTLDAQPDLRRPSQTFSSADVKLADLQPGGRRGRGFDPCLPSGVGVVRRCPAVNWEVSHGALLACDYGFSILVASLPGFCGPSGGTTTSRGWAARMGETCAVNFGWGSSGTGIRRVKSDQTWTGRMLMPRMAIASSSGLKYPTDHFHCR